MNFFARPESEFTCSKVAPPKMLKDVIQRMKLQGEKPFRKIKVRQHLMSGVKPNALHSLQASRIVADELTVRLGRRCSEVAALPYNAGQLPFAQEIMGLYQQTCKELFEWTDMVESLRRNPHDDQSFLEQTGSKWSIASIFKPKLQFQRMASRYI